MRPDDTANNLFVNYLFHSAPLRLCIEKEPLSYSLGAGFASSNFFKMSSWRNLSDSAWKFSRIL